MAEDVKEENSSSSSSEEGSAGVFMILFSEIISSPLNLSLVAAIVFLAYKLLRGGGNKTNTGRGGDAPPRTPPLPRMKKRDMPIEELAKYDGKGEDGRILIAVNGKVFDVTRGKKFYGPGGPYAAFGGKDASRSLATFSIDAVRDTYDDLSDLNTMQMDSVREWEMQFTEKYDFVGRLLRPGEEPTSYSDEEDDASQTESKNESEQEKPKDE